MESSGQNTGVGGLALLQGIFPTQGSNPGLPHCRRILYHLGHQESQGEVTQIQSGADGGCLHHFLSNSQREKGPQRGQNGQIILNLDPFRKKKKNESNKADLLKLCFLEGLKK